jgi:hypothetical protein
LGNTKKPFIRIMWAGKSETHFHTDAVAGLP